MKLRGKDFSKPTYYVDNQEDLALASQELAGSKKIGVDTESNSLHAYDEQVCFVQISNAKANYIFDTIRLNDLRLLGPLFEDSATEKIFHGADYDIGLLKRDFGLSFSNLFDTMAAAQFLNMEKIGMADLVEICYGIHLEKKYTKCDWAERPVSIDKMVYLCQDTQYLIGLRDWLHRQLGEKDLMEEAALEFEHLEKRPALEPAYSNQTVWDIKGIKALDKSLLPYITELFKWRSRQAKKQNTPPFKVLNNKTIIEIAKLKPRTREELLSIKGVTDNLWRRYGKFIISAIERGGQYPPGWAPAVEPKREGRRSIHYDDQELAEKIKKWRQERAQASGIHPLAVLPGHLLIDLCLAKPQDLDQLAAMEGFGRVRVKKYGDEILRLLKS